MAANAAEPIAGSIRIRRRPESGLASRTVQPASGTSVTAGPTNTSRRYGSTADEPARRP